MQVKGHFSYNSLYYISLVYLFFPVFGVYLFDYPLWTLILTAIYALAYLYLVRSQKLTWLLPAWFYLLIYIVYMTSFISVGMAWFLFFPSNLLANRFREKKKVYLLASMIGAPIVMIAYQFLFVQSMENKIMIVVVPFFCLGLMFVTLHLRHYEDQEEELAQKNAYINLLSAENERNRIGRDLHDTLGHVFAMMTIKSELALKQLEQANYDSVHKELQELNQISRDSMQEVRTIVNNLKYRTITEELDHLQELFALTDMDFEVSNDLEVDNLSPLLQSSLTMIVRELTNNAIKHSQASTCHLQLYRDQQAIHVQATDDGRGFEELTGQELNSIRERLLLVDGQVEIISAKKPTQIKISIFDKEH